LGITTNESNSTSPRISAVSNHSSYTINPKEFTTISSFIISPNKQSRLKVQMVIKYSAGEV